MNGNSFMEKQAFPIWAYGIMGVSTVAAVGAVLLEPREGTRAAITLPVLLAMGLTANLLSMKTTVDAEAVTVTFGALFPLYRRRIPRAEIAAAHAETYSPLGEFGGWGIRGWGNNVALNARGMRGVRLTLKDGRRILIGSQRPDELAAALRPQTDHG